MTSRDVVNIVANRIAPYKAGHAGTLDPLAEGVLVLGVGRASRLVSYVQDYEKQYAATFRLGVASASGDLEQELIEYPEDPVPTFEELTLAAQTLTGEIEQTPSAFSAIWVDGKRAYERVRNGETVEMPSRRVLIHALTLTRYEYPWMDLEIICGSGTYIRSLGVDLAATVNTHAVMSHLCRTRIGPFAISASVEALSLKNTPIQPWVQPATMGVEHLPKMQLDGTLMWRVGNGLCVDAETHPSVHPNQGGVVAAIAPDGRLHAILRGKTKQGNPAWYPEKVFHVES
ncbi:tRNA pseudouridine synthase B [Novipirellula artificiosorum]|uniref:tRNA pseudouridine synthase B n=2 Tax=Novipirellula artificiosorum TaxID=2528016 RepID=A0A5C6D7F1_9BACT|nr:tRNA pseudouridine synthase B [Novipirellula artificiosorum]